MSAEGKKQLFWSNDVQKLDWVQSDGKSYVNLNFTPTNPNTEIYLEICAATPLDKVPIVWAGASSSGLIDGSDTTNPQFGFSEAVNDRQTYIRVGVTRWWNRTPYAGSWSDGNWHQISVKVNSASKTCSCAFDGNALAMENEGGNQNSSYAMPATSQRVFTAVNVESPSSNLINNVVKVKRIAYRLDDEMLADFYAAKSGDRCGFYDVVRHKFFPASGSLLHS